MRLDEAKEILENNGYVLEESERLKLDDKTLKEKSECANNFIHSIAKYTDRYFEGRTSRFFKDYGIETMRQIIFAVYEYAEKMCELNGRPCNLETLKQLLKDEYFVNYNWKNNNELNRSEKILNKHGYLVEAKVATKEDFDNLFKLHGFEKTVGDFDWVKKVYQRYGKGYLKAIVGKDSCKIVYFKFDPTLHYDEDKCYELNDSYTVSFDTEDAVALLRDYIMDYDKE